MVERPQRIRSCDIQVSFPHRRRLPVAAALGVSLGCLYVCLRALRYRRVVR